MRIISQKKINEALKRLCANQIIITDLFEKGLIDVEIWDCSADNTIEISEIIGGYKGCLKVLGTLKNRADRILEREEQSE